MCQKPASQPPPPTTPTSTSATPTTPKAASTTHDELPIDRGWAWVILVASFLCLLCICGALYSVSVFNLIFLEVFHASSATTSWAGSVLIGLMALMGPVSSALTERFGWRFVIMLGGVIASLGTLMAAFATNLTQLLICFGIVTGIGHGLAYTPAIVVVGYYFERYRTAASGLASVGAGGGMLIFPLLIEYMITHYTWRETLVLTAGIYLQVVVFGALMRPLDLSKLQKELIEQERTVDDTVPGTPRSLRTPSGSRLTVSSTRTIRCMHLPRRRMLTFCALKQSLQKLTQMKFLIFLWSIFTFGIGLSALYLHLSAFMMNKGASERESMLLLSITGVASILSRVFTGIAGNDHTIDNLILYIGTFGITGICTLFCPVLAVTYHGRVAYALFLGFYGSCFNVLLAPLTVELIGLQFLTTAFGIEMVVNGVAYLLGPPIAGWLFDYTGSYDSSFYLAGVCLISSSIIMMLVSVFEKTTQKGETAYLYTMAAQEEVDVMVDDFEDIMYKDEFDPELQLKQQLSEVSPSPELTL